MVINDQMNIPVQLISSCSTLGELTPLRFRFENDEHKLETVDINQIISTKELKINGLHEIIFTCIANIFYESKLFELKYNVISHKWFIFRVLN